MTYRVAPFRSMTWTDTGVTDSRSTKLRKPGKARLPTFGSPELRSFEVPLTVHDRASMFSAMKSESWKKCGTCLRRRPVAEFAISSRRSRDGLANVCMACVRFLKAVRAGQFDEQDAPGGPVDTALSDRGYQWWDYRPRGALARVRVLRGPDGRPVDVSVALAQIEAALGAPAGCWRPAGRRQVCRRSCCTRRHRP